MEDIRLESQADRLGAINTAVVMEGQNGKEYRLPTDLEIDMAASSEADLNRVYPELPYGCPEDLVPEGSSRVGGGSPFTVYLYGLKRWRDLFSPRQLLAMGVLAKCTRQASSQLAKQGYPAEWVESVTGYLSVQNDKVADYNSMICVWHLSGEKIGHTFTRFALPITWDYTELAIINAVGGAYSAQLDWVARYVDHALRAATDRQRPSIHNCSAIQIHRGEYDAVVTDPPYYDAIPYADLMDFFYVWLRRTLREPQWKSMPHLTMHFRPSGTTKKMTVNSSMMRVVMEATSQNRELFMNMECCAPLKRATKCLSPKVSSL
jgi:adenine-specific DNA methylase